MAKTKTNTKTNTTVVTAEELKNKAIKNKITFDVWVSIDGANINGDPNNENRPRTTEEANGNIVGLISDVCIKRKIRKALMRMGHDVLLQSSDMRVDDAVSVVDRIKKDGFGEYLEEKADKEELARLLCEKYIDVRAFGTVGTYCDKSSFGVTGPVSITMAKSVDPIEIETIDIVNNCPIKEDCRTGKKESSSMGKKHFVKFGLYRFSVNINVQLAEKTGFSDVDVEAIKEAIRTLFVNDASAARPDGSCEVAKIFCFEHNCKDGQYSAAKIKRAISAKLVDGVTTPMSIEDYEITYNELDGLKYEIIDGF